jgi:hypothetical protein
VGSTRSRRFSAQDFTHRLALSSIGTFVDDRLHATVSLGDFTRVLGNQNPAEAVELCIVEITFLDMPNTKPVTKTMRRPCTKLARTPPGAVAIYELDSANHPSVIHGWSPPDCL